MPVITPQGARATVSAQTEEAWKPVHRTLTVNTRAATLHNPYSAPDAPIKEAAERAESDGEEQPGGSEGKIGQENINEDTAQVETQSQSEVVTLSPQLTALARREQKFRQQEQQFKAEKQAWEAQKADQAELSKLAKIKERLDAKDFAALEELGVTYDEYTNYLLNKPDEDKPELKAIKNLESEIDKMKAEREEDTNKKYEATVNQYRRDIKSLVARDPAYSTIAETDNVEAVVQHILDTFEQDDEVLTLEDAAQDIEDYLVEEALRMTKLSKIQQKLAPEKPSLPPPQQKSQQTAGLKTLTQQIAPSKPQRTYPQFQHLSPKERLQQALAKAQKPRS